MIFFFLHHVSKIKRYADQHLDILVFHGMIKDTNHLIKVIRRLAFDYHSFIQCKTRILLISNILSLSFSPEKESVLATLERVFY